MNTIFTYKIKNPKSLPLVGFKIHVSATPYNFKKVLNIVLPYLDKNHFNYKYISNSKNILKNFSILENASSSGKLITIYPDDNLQFKKILNDLYKIIPYSTAGIYVLSDHPYRNSNNIFYRYGFFKKVPQYTKNGIPTLAGPNGEIWQDYQKNYFDLPSWIDDIQDIKFQEKSYLSENYSIEKMIHSANGGNVYKGFSKNTHKYIIMKEAKPYILFFNNIEKSTLRQNEYQLSKKIHKYIPTAIERVKEWKNTYYIYEYIDGMNLTTYAKDFTLFSFKRAKEKNNAKRFKIFLAMIYKLLELVDCFHQNDIILNDIHSDNFIIDQQNNIYFVDLEASYEYKNKPIVGIYNKNSLKYWNNIDGKVADCHKIGNMILYLIGRLQINSKLTNELNILTNLLRSYGIDSNVGNLINYLFTPSASIKKAIEILKEVYVKNNYEFCLDDKLKVLKKPLSSYESLSANTFLSKYIYQNNLNCKKYLKNLNNPDYIKYLIDSERNCGLEGLSGILIILNKLSYNKSIISYGIDKIISNIIDTSNGKMIKINNNTASPYLSNGSSGVIKALLNIDSKKHKKIIEDLSNGIETDFAQRPNYWNGMLGIADTLLDSYTILHNKNYIESATNLIINSSYYLDSDKLSKKELTYVFNRLNNLQTKNGVNDEITF